MPVTSGVQHGPLNWMARPALCLVAIAASAACAPAQRNTPLPRDGVGILSGLHTAFATTNPKIDKVWIQQLLTTEPWPARRGEYAIIAMGLETGAVPKPPGKEFGLGQLFGVFVVDSAFSRVDRALYVFPTRRWLDYRVRFGDVDSDSITILGEGDTYGDQRVGWTFDWTGNGRHEVAWPPDSTRSNVLFDD